MVPFLLICFYSNVRAQVKPGVRITVLNDKKAALAGATVYLLTVDSVALRTAAANSTQDHRTTIAGVNHQRNKCSVLPSLNYPNVS